jgi:hypothetical protein
VVHPVVLAAVAVIMQAMPTLVAVEQQVKVTRVEETVMLLVVEVVVLEVLVQMHLVIMVVMVVRAWHTTLLEALNTMQQVGLVEPIREQEALVVLVLVVTLVVAQVVQELIPAQQQILALVVVQMVI